MKILFCKKCKLYTLKEVCQKCKEKTASPHPPKFSLEKEEKFGKYRRQLKSEDFNAQ